MLNLIKCVHFFQTEPTNRPESQVVSPYHSRMVRGKQRDLNELILEVFEEQEEQFYYPVNSQKQARAFVKALYTKGFDYSSLCQEISEFEHNFTAWRKGLGRSGIGKRLIARINKPLQDLLDADVLPTREFTAEQNGQETMRFERNSQTRTARGPKSGESRRQRKSPQQTSSSSGSSDSGSPAIESRNSGNRDQKQITSSWLNQIEGKISAVEQRIHSVIENDKSVKNSMSEQQNKSKEASKADPDGKGEAKLSSSVQKKNFEDGRKGIRGQSGDAEPPRIVSAGPDFVSTDEDSDSDRPSLRALLRDKDSLVLKRGDQDEKRRSVRDRISLFNDMTNPNQEGQSSNRGSPIRNGRKSLSPEPMAEANRNSSQENSTTPETSPTSPERTIGSDYSRNSMSPEPVLEEIQEVASVHKVAGNLERFEEGSRHKTDLTTQASPDENEASKEKTVAVVAEPAEVEKCSVDEGKQLDTTPGVETETRSGNVSNDFDKGVNKAEDEFTSLISELEGENPDNDTSMPSSTENNTTPNKKVAPLVSKEMMDFMDDVSSAASNRSNKLVLDEEDFKASAAGTNTVNFSTATNLDDLENDESLEFEVDENYDSDLDPEAGDRSDEFSDLLTQLSMYKGRVGDGPGYIYVFSDNRQKNADDEESRFCIGASRYPTKRLEQARMFNLDIHLETMASVSLRREALQVLYEKVEALRVSSANAWFKGSMEQAVECVASIAETFPLDSSTC